MEPPGWGVTALLSYRGHTAAAGAVCQHCRAVSGSQGGWDLDPGACHLSAGVEKMQVSRPPGVCMVARGHVCKRLRLQVLHTAFSWSHACVLVF